MMQQWQRVWIALLAVVVAELLTLAIAAASAGTIIEYPLPANSGTTTVTTCNSSGHHCTTTKSTSSYCSCPATIAPGPDGKLWFTETGGALGYGAIGTVSPTSGAITEYKLPTFNSIPVGISAGPAGTAALWFTEQSSNRIGRITTAGSIIEFVLPVTGSQPRGIALGSDENLWFTESRTSGTTTGYIGRITPAGAITEFAVPYAWSRPFLITSGPDGNMWFSDEGTNSVGTIAVAGPVVGAVTEFKLPSASAGPGPHGITGGPDGNLWVAEANTSMVAQVTTAGIITEFSAPGGPAGIVTGPDKNLWFTEATNTSGVGVMTTSGTVLNSFSLGTTQYKDPQGITVGSDSRLWFTEEFGGTYGSIGAITSS
jgi:virginiamycin B lyase